jgi:hypothetical protein
MAYIFIDDKSPESHDYESNYIFFNEDDLDSLEQALTRVKSIAQRVPFPLTAEIAVLERVIARKKSAMTDPVPPESLG